MLQYGPNIFSATSTRDLLILLVAGVVNAGALLSLSRALTLTTSGRVNTINTLSIALSAIFAATIFKEPITPAIVMGIALIIAGIVRLQRHLIPSKL
jgi:drug/metabolite transporter (DMT)-like permease